MTLQHHHPDPEALGLQHNCIYLTRNGAMQSYGKTAEFFRNAHGNPELTDGRMLVLQNVNGPQDVHYPTWEMHPEGDELLILVSGSLAVECRNGEHDRITLLPPQAAFIVPAGIWHRLIVHAPSALIAITARRNTAHRKG